MSIDKLIKIIQPPRMPSNIPDAVAWDRAERIFGKLPADYKEFAMLYGDGTICDFIWILNPGSTNNNLNYVTKTSVVLDAMRSVILAGEACPFAMWPERDGLLPFGITDNGDVLYWHTCGDADMWTVVVNAGRDSEYEQYRCSMSEFIISILEKKIRCQIFPDEFPGKNIVFSVSPCSLQA